MYNKHHTKGIVISSKFDSENSKYLNIFTKDFGLINVRAQSVRNNISKLRFSIQDLSFGDFSILFGKTGWRLVGASASKNLFEVFKYEKSKLAIVVNILNLIKRLTSEDNSNQNLFDIVFNLISFLESNTEDKNTFAECSALLKILHNLGYMRNDPNLSLPINTPEINILNLDLIDKNKAYIVKIINESIKATNL